MSSLTPVIVTVTQAGAPNKTLNLTVLLEGLYAGNGMMNAVRDASGYHYGSAIADQITVELHDATTYSTIIYTVSSVNLSTSGLATVTIPPAYTGSYYLTIKHRNSLKTVSSTAVSFASNTIAYNFTDGSAKAFGGNLQSSGDGKWVIYSGDVNQDDAINTTDMTVIETASGSFSTGYVNTDITGDGVVDMNDLTVADNNSSLTITAITP